jgi:protein O-GlcNAc transferase
MSGQSAEAQFNLGNSLRAAGKFDDALAAYRKALELRPNYQSAHFKLGYLLAAQGNYAEAAAAFREVLKLDPNHLDAMNNLASALLSSDQPQEAVALYRRVLAVRPEHFLARSNLAAGLLALREIDEAMEAARWAVAARPDYPPAHRNFGDALAAVGNWPQAAQSFKKLLDLESARPGHTPGSVADAQVRLGSALKHLGKFDQAIALFRAAIAGSPDDLAALEKLANAVWEMGQMDEALAIAREMARRHPDLSLSHSIVGNVTLERGGLDEAISSFAKAVELDSSNPAALSNKIFACLFHPAYDSARQLEELKQWEKMYASSAPEDRDANDPSLDRRLRIGYVSADLRDHVIGRNLMPLMQLRDRAQFEVFCYSGTTNFDPMNRRFRELADAWRDVGAWTDDKLIRQIRGDKIDVLMDLSLHTGGHRLQVFAHRPAPVQVTFGGYPGTTGLHAVDYRLTDPYLDPPGQHDEDYVERSIRLPHSFWCYDPAAMEVENFPQPGPPPAASAGYVTFGCLNNFRKISDVSLELWARVMGRLPDSRLLILAPLGGHRDALAQRMVRWGVDPDRIGFVDRGPRENYLDAYRRIDIFLDTIPYNGHTTSLDSIWLGVPVVTIVGNTVVGRAGWSQACNLGLTDLAARSGEQFVEIASSLAKDLPRLAELRRSLRDRMRKSPICDAAGWTRGIEAAYRQMWRTWCETRKP